MRRIWLVLAAVLLCVEIGYGAEIEIPAEVTDAVPPEAAVLLDGADGAAQEGTLWTGIGRLWRSACAYVRTALESQTSGAAVLLGIVLLCSMAESCFAAADAPGVPRFVTVAGSLAIALVAAGDFRQMMGLGVETMEQLDVFAKALLPTLAAAVAAGGGYVTAGAQQVATVFFTNLLISVIRKVLLPLLYIFRKPLGSALPAVCAVYLFVIGALFVLNFIIGGLIGGFVLAWRLLVAVWYVPLTIYRLIMG